MGPDGQTSLNEPTLVLNRAWVPINTTTVRHAITLAIKDAAYVIQPETYEAHSFESWAMLVPKTGENVIRGVNRHLRIPEVIVLARYDRIPRKHVPFTRKNLYRRDDHRCQYCGARKSLDLLSIDHVLPRCRGGQTSWMNCVLACVRCNIRKGSRLLSEVDMRLMRPPRSPQWSPCLGIRRIKRKTSWQRFVNATQWSLEFET